MIDKTSLLFSLIKSENILTSAVLSYDMRNEKMLRSTKIKQSTRVFSTIRMRTILHIISAIQVHKYD